MAVEPLTEAENLLKLYTERHGKTATTETIALRGSCGISKPSPYDLEILKVASDTNRTSLPDESKTTELDI